MNWPEVIGRGFPAPHEREPVHLRRDITDELNDHLLCAMRRELRRNPDEIQAERAVLDRFGNPKKLAYRLWWEAMKEIVMKDRIMLGVIVVLAVAVVAMSVFVWLGYQQSQSFNQTILAQMKAMMDRGNTESKPMDWVSLQVKLVEDNENGKPIPGATIQLDGSPFDGAKNTTLTADTNEQGLAEFGPIKPGEYTISVYNMPSGYHHDGSQKIVLYPGMNTMHTIICPKEANMPKATVRFNIEWPENLDTKSLVVSNNFIPISIDALGNRWIAWSPLEGPLMGDGTIIPVDESNGVLRLLNVQTEEITWSCGSYQLESIAIYSNHESIARRSEDQEGSYNPDQYFRVADFEYPENERPVVRIEPGQVNTITIKPPQAMIDELRKALSEAEAEARTEATQTNPS